MTWTSLGGIFMLLLFKKKWIHIILVLISALLLSSAIPMESAYGDNKRKTIIEDATEVKNNKIYEENKDYQNDIAKNSVQGNLKVHFIDVGDADSILIQQGNSSMLIDAGNDADSNVVKDYLSRQGVTSLDFLVGTHMDEDHIGSMDEIIECFDIGKIFMPQSQTKTKYMEDVINAAGKKTLQITAPVPEEEFNVGNALCTVLAPVSMEYERLNNYSVVIKLQYGNTSFLFTGDAERISENEMMRRGYDLSADVLKLGHHGSIRSTSKEFLDRVNPKYAVLMVGSTNKYCHPHRRTMEKLKDRKIQVYRTDESGTITALSDGQSIIFDKKPGTYRYRGR
jgi:competence protein ComEC